MYQQKLLFKRDGKGMTRDPKFSTCKLQPKRISALLQKNLKDELEKKMWDMRSDANKGTKKE